MQTSVTADQPSLPWINHLKWFPVPVLAGLVWLPEIKSLWQIWVTDPTLSSRATDSARCRRPSLGEARLAAAMGLSETGVV